MKKLSEMQLSYSEVETMNKKWRDIEDRFRSSNKY